MIVSARRLLSLRSLIRGPLSSLGRRTRIRLVRQDESAECGLACFVMIANHHGRDLRLPAVRRVASSSRGATMASLATLARRFGFEGRGVQLGCDDLAALAVPAILHWNHDHFVVLERVRGDAALIHDPNGASRWLTLTALSRHFTGFALEIWPVQDEATPAAPARRRIWALPSYMRGTAPRIRKALALTLLLQLAILVTPYSAQLAFDRALPARDADLLARISVLFGAFVLLSGALSLARLSVILSISATFSQNMASSIKRKLLRLPLDWFRRRDNGEVIAKFSSIFPIRHVLSEDVPTILINGIVCLLTIAVMLFYSPMLSLIGGTALLLFGVARFVLMPRQQAALTLMIQASGREQSALIGSLRCMRSLRLSCREEARHDDWFGHFRQFVDAEVRYKMYTNWQNVFQTTLLGLTSIAVVWVGVLLVMRGPFTAGMIFAFMAYQAQFLAAGMAIIDKYANLRELETHLERLSDITDTEEDPAFAHAAAPAPRLLGKLELRHVAYSYDVDGQRVLRDVNLIVQPGESVAITGPSGGGKSTLAQLILGLDRPRSGTILADDVELGAFGYRHYHAQIAAVLQDEGLFAGTVLENIALYDAAIDMDLVRACARAAAIDAEIEAWPMRYRTPVGEMGTAVSSGQRQRILLARALYRQPRILVLDEGTAHLDSETERRVNQAIRALGITRISFAHRKETIASADRVLFLRDGCIHEHRG